ncbi:unnamed protein product [Paramecium sonneborni]|uniref:H-type lectin domain-containing protein n=1 Tax=Paramecium sonneborni TaxID=65129 RepID=A0A8S1P1U5_9CILI|nr:unnamed protein product [Paramecium sonneborni]
MKIIITILCFYSGYSVIYYDSGFYANLERSGTYFVCQNSYSNTYTIAFSNSFVNIPQVFLLLQHIDTPTLESEFQVSISSITLNNFQIYVFCPRPGVIWSIRFEWIAIDDQRIQVINSFNMIPPSDKTFNHQLLNADVAILAINTLGYLGQIDFQISITSLTKDSVSVGITKVTGKYTNLLQIGYQILLASQKDIIDLGLLTFIPDFTKGGINLESNKIFLLPFQGIKFNYGRQQTIKILKTIGTSTVTINANKWGGTYDASQYIIQQVWLSYQFFTNKASQCYTMRISQKLERSSNSLPQFYVEIPNANQIYNSIGESTFRVYKPIFNIDFIVKAKCIYGKRIRSSFNKCNDCSISKTYEFKHYCHSQINLVSYFPQFQQSQNVNQEFKVKITENTCQIYQILYNQVKEEYTIINIYFQDV